MKKLLASTFAISAIFLGASAGTVVFAAEEGYEAWKGNAVSLIQTSEGVWQPNAGLGVGSSTVYYVLEEDRGEENGFLRLSNYDNVLGSESTSVNLPFSSDYSEGDVLNVSFRYRFVEGKTRYGAEEAVLTLSVGATQKVLTFSDLSLANEGTREWNQASVEIPAASYSDRMTITYHFEREASYQEELFYFDIDLLQVQAGSNRLVASEAFDFVTAEKIDANLLDSFDYSELTVTAKEEYLLAQDEIVRYSVNTAYAQTEQTSFGGGSSAVALAHAGTSGTYRGSASAKAGESDCFAIYNESDKNTFLRMGNFNGAEGVSQTRFNMYFYNGLSGQQETMPATAQIVFSFHYRLYLDDVEAIKRSGGDAVFMMETRSSSTNNSGKVELDDLIVNEKGDDTWHTYTGILQTRRTSTAYFVFYFYGSESASFETGTYADIDNFSVKTETGEINYAHLAGTFEGLVPETSTEDPFNGQVYRETGLGEGGRKIEISSENYAMQLLTGQNTFLRMNWTPTTNVYHVSFSVLSEEGEINLHFSGRGGSVLPLTVGQNFTSASGDARVTWTKSGEVWTCHLFYARLAPELMQSIGFVNVGEAPIIIDDIFVGEVVSVCNTAGNFEEFSTSLAALKAEYEAEKDNYTAAADKNIRYALYEASFITEYSSAENMSNCVNALSALLENGTRKADLTRLNMVIELAETILKEGSKDDYASNGWILFRAKLAEAYAASEENTQEEINALVRELNACISALEKVQTPEENNNGLAVALGVSGGVVGLGGIAVGAFLIQRRKKV